MTMMFCAAATLSRLSVNLFLDDFGVSGDTSLKGPVLLVANHATHTDPEYVVQAIPSHRLRFFATATVFRGLLRAFVARLPLVLLGGPDGALYHRLHAWAERQDPHVQEWLFRQLHMIPVLRPEDGHTSRADMAANMKRFKEEARRAVQKQEILTIFGEGKVAQHWDMEVLRGGASIVAFETVEEYQRSLHAGDPVPEPTLVMMGIVPGEFDDIYRGSVTVVMGARIPLAQWVADHGNDRKALTALMNDAFDEIAVRGVPDAHTVMIERLARLYRGIERSNRVRVGEIARHVLELVPQNADLAAEMERKLSRYANLAETLKVPYGEELHESLFRPFLVMLSPLVYIGYLVHLVPIYLIANGWKALPMDRFVRNEAMLFSAIRTVLGWYGALLVGLCALGFIGIVPLVTVPLLYFASAVLGILAAKLYRRTNFALLSLLRWFRIAPRRFNELVSLGRDIDRVVRAAAGRSKR
jgi:1-acyl-sn-glycerol-3-phosphate acyltransferase